MRDQSEAHRLLAASYAHLGQAAEARYHAEQILAVHPNFSIAHWRRVSADRSRDPVQRLIEGLLKAGLPDN
jgi:adenylate cyclase